MSRPSCRSPSHLQEYHSLQRDDRLVRNFVRTINKILYVPAKAIIDLVTDATGASRVAIVVRQSSQVFRQFALSFISRSKSGVLLLSCVLMMLDRL